jgi:ATP-dependent exoDNAse (exonuclease V) beta subunit
VRATSSTLEEGSRVVQEDLFATVTPFSGPSFGDVVHKCLELYDSAAESPAETALRRAIEAISGGRPGATRDWVLQWQAHDRDAVLRDLERLVRDPALLPIWRARRARREVPFLLPMGGDFLSGTVDVLIEGADGTVSIADFKTDRALSVKKSLSPRHRRQALLTAFAVQEITKRVVREFRFLFLATDPVTTVSLPISSDEISEARSLLHRLRLQNDGAASLETAPSQDPLSIQGNK